MGTDVTLRIKNLSISLEALSRINNKGSGSLYIDIETLLREEINSATKENNSHRSTTASTDDIPF